MAMLIITGGWITTATNYFSVYYQSELGYEIFSQALQYHESKDFPACYACTVFFCISVASAIYHGTRDIKSVCFQIAFAQGTIQVFFHQRVGWVGSENGNF